MLELIITIIGISVIISVIGTFVLVIKREERESKVVPEDPRVKDLQDRVTTLEARAGVRMF